MKFSLLCFSLLLCCTGCIAFYSISNHPEYRPYIGQTVTLMRPLLLVSHRTLFLGTGATTMGYARYLLTEQESDWGSGTIFARLPRGYPATVDSVHEEFAGDNHDEVVYGHIINPTNGERASFAYKSYQSPLPWRLAVAGH